jgi:hypothetical protein
VVLPHLRETLARVLREIVDLLPMMRLRARVVRHDAMLPLPMHWWLKLRADDAPRGPYPTRDIARRVRGGELTKDMLVRLDEPDDVDWNAIDTVSEIGDELDLLEAEHQALLVPRTPPRAQVRPTRALLALCVVGGVLWIATTMLRDYLHLSWLSAGALALAFGAALVFAFYKWS